MILAGQFRRQLRMQTPIVTVELERPFPVAKVGIIKSDNRPRKEVEFRIVIGLEDASQGRISECDYGTRGVFALLPDNAKYHDVRAITRASANDRDHDQWGPASGEMGLSAAGLIPSEVVRIENSISAGEFTVERPVVRVMSADMARKIVGTYFLENFKVTFPARNKRIQLSGFDKTTWTPPAVRSLGMGLKHHGDQMLVWYMHPESHAAKIGIQTDDVIMTVNGEPVQEIFGSQRWQTMLQSSEQVTIQYQAKVDKSTRTANIKILEILSAVDHP